MHLQLQVLEGIDQLPQIKVKEQNITNHLVRGESNNAKTKSEYKSK